MSVRSQLLSTAYKGLTRLRKQHPAIAAEADAVLIALEAWIALLAASAVPPQAQHQAMYEAAIGALVKTRIVHGDMPDVGDVIKAVYDQLTLAKP